ncbi:hypothetical protein CCUS01_17001 [Colletotrichum cuscutae]|uniref:Roadblock/LAMTOR2 domain-containing protein n=1 Tax=Colletotrichum cuscutae TaxID=1209917 RepID=A0AAI9V7Y1_9PEZI|nr:hypothetical protein CCUS01_17001 [Colletotrichum cuscutae]
MADATPLNKECVPSQTNGPDALDETLKRLSNKPGVKATVILDRVTGAILRTSGQLSSFNAATLQTSGGGSFSGEGAAAQQQQNGEEQPQGLEDFAAKVWNWVNASGTLVLDLDTEYMTHRRLEESRGLTHDVGIDRRFTDLSLLASPIGRPSGGFALAKLEGQRVRIDMLIGRLQDHRIYKYAGKGNRETLLQAAKLQALRTYTHMENKQGGKER